MPDLILPIPKEALVGLSPPQVAELSQWWNAIAPAERDEFVERWDARSEDTAWYVTHTDGATEWHELPLELRGFFAVDREAVHESEQWKSQLNEYINNHEDIIFFLVDDHPLHICRAHPEARQILTNAEIPADFRCPFARDALCPFEKALTLSAHRPITLRLCPRNHPPTPSTRKSKSPIASIPLHGCGEGFPCHHVPLEG